VVVDTTGKVLGRYGGVAATVQATAYMTIDGSAIAIPLLSPFGATDPSKLYFREGEIYFEGTACQGQAYVLGRTKVVFGAKLSANVSDGTGRWFLYVASGAALTRTIESRYYAGACEAIGTIPATDAYQVSAPIELTTQYSQPFTIR
jgi:hypothetical protein